MTLAFAASGHVVFKVTLSIICTCSPDNHIKEPLNIFMSFEFNCSFQKTSQNWTSTELPEFIRTRLMSQLLCWTLMIKGSSSWGLTLMASSSEKIMSTSVFSYGTYGKARGYNVGREHLFPISSLASYRVALPRDTPSNDIWFVM